MIQNEKDVLEFLSLPSIPKKKWDGHSSFKRGVAILNLVGGRKAYAVATYNAAEDSKPRTTKVFDLEPFVDIDEIFVVPDYMDADINAFDVDEESKRAAEMLAEEAEAMENEGVDEPEIEKPTSEYFFDFIENDEQAQAYIRSYNKQKGIKKRVPTNHEHILMRLATIYYEQKK